jgi:signal transduction histidine kinase
MDLLTELAHAVPLALLFAVPVAVAGGLLTLRMRRRSMAVAMPVLVVVPLIAALVGIVGTSGFMYTPQLVGTVAVVIVVGAITVPAGMLLGRRMAREALWQREARDAERRAEASRRALVAGLSHDLRSPLAGILAMTDALLDGVVHRPDEVAGYLKRLHAESVRVAGMVEDLFELSRATSAALRLQRKRLALCEVGSDAVAAGTAAGVDVQVRANDPDNWPIVLGSEPELTRVIRNLVGNAIRHTPPGGVVRIAAGTRGENAWLTVRDECGGIPQDELPRLFQAGFRGTAARTPDARSGAGLGLTIAKALVSCV